MIKNALHRPSITRMLFFTETGGPGAWQVRDCTALVRRSLMRAVFAISRVTSYLLRVIGE